MTAAERQRRYRWSEARKPEPLVSNENARDSKAHCFKALALNICPEVSRDDKWGDKRADASPIRPAPASRAASRDLGSKRSQVAAGQEARPGRLSRAPGRASRGPGAATSGLSRGCCPN